MFWSRVDQGAATSQSRPHSYHRSLVEPNIGQILSNEVAWRDAPAFELRRGCDNAIPPQEGHRVSFGQSMLLEIADDFCALPGVIGYRLTDKESIEETVGRIRVVDRRQIVRHVFGQLNRRVVIEVAGEIERHVELACIDFLLPIPDVPAVLRRRDTDLSPALG